MILNLAEGQGKTKIAYSGNCTTKTITVNGSQYILYTITGSGTLTVKGKAVSGVGIWGCGGGANGENNSKIARGGAGGYFTQLDSYTLATGAYVITIGAAQGNTGIQFGSTSALSANGATSINGGSGGGGSGYIVVGPGAVTKYYSPGTGVGKATRPFGDATNFPNLPCAGGGGAASSDSYEQSDDWTVLGGINGGAGGSNGGGGSAATSAGTSIAVNGGSGGSYGGGRGYSPYRGAGTAATFYGSGGGGNNRGSAYAGYQGVVFIRIPA